MVPRIHIRRWGLPVACLMSAAFAAAGRLAAEPDSESRIHRLIPPVASGVQDAEVETSIRRVLHQSPDHAEALWLLATVLAARGDHAQSWACFHRIPSTHPQGLRARLAEGDELLQLGDASIAETVWREAANDDRLRLDARQRLLALFGFQLRRSKWRAELIGLIEAGRGGLREVVQLIIVSHVVWEGDGIIETLQRFVETNKEDFLSRASLVHHLLAAGRSDDAERQLDALMNHPSHDEVALAAMAFAVANADPGVVKRYRQQSGAVPDSRLSTIPAWRRGLGELRLMQGDPAGATDHLTFAAKREPFHPGGRQQLALALRLLNRTNDAALHARAASVLARLDRTCHSMQNSGQWTEEKVLLVAKDAASIGMMEEAKAWLRFAMASGAKDPRIAEWLVRVENEPPTSVANPPERFLDPAGESPSR